MNVLVQAMLPELILIGTACLLFLIGASSKVGARRAAKPSVRFANAFGSTASTGRVILRRIGEN